jgi:hypothetical protein
VGLWSRARYRQQRAVHSLAETYANGSVMQNDADKIAIRLTSHQFRGKASRLAQAM